jgi:hypothetical protein
VPESVLARETVAGDEPRTTAEFIAFLKAASLARHPAGPVPRFNQGRSAGCVDAEFTVLADLPADCRIGLFSEPRTYAAWIRFAHASSASDREKDVRGMSITLPDAGGENLTPGSTAQDFVLNSHPVMMVAGPAEFLRLLQAVEAGGVRRALYFLTHPGAARIAYVSRQHHPSHLDITYWSTTPYLFGAGRAVKYIVRPSRPSSATAPNPPTDNYLRDALVRRLAREDVSFDFLVQFQTDARTMPIEDASVEWPEQQSPYRLVARVRIPPQTVADHSRDSRCETIAFNPWHARVEHRPLGSFNRARREIYPAMAAFRDQRARAALSASSGTR